MSRDAWIGSGKKGPGPADGVLGMPGERGRNNKMGCFGGRGNQNEGAWSIKTEISVREKQGSGLGGQWAGAGH